MIDFKKYGVVEVAEMAGDDAEDTKLLEEMLSRATAYMHGCGRNFRHISV
jgi:hypothetical protein